MACVPLPSVPLPTLPDPLTIDPPDLPPFGGSLELCCKLLSIAAVTPPITLPPGTLNSGIVAFINTNIALVQAYLDALPLSCPRE